MKFNDLGPPVAITAAHDTQAFDCGDLILNNWLRERALRNHLGKYTHVRVITAGERIVGYHGVSAASLVTEIVPRSLRGGQPPNPIPAFLIGRLAVDRSWQGRGLGADLLHDALQRCLAASAIVGARLVAVRASDEIVASFYAAYDFIPTRNDPLLLVQSIERVEKAVR